LERTEPDGHRIHHQELGNPACVIAAKDTALMNDGKKLPANFVRMRERAFCGMSSSMLLERFPEVQSLGPEDKWRLIDELWSDLAQQVEGEAPNENIVELLEKRFSDYLVDPSQGQSADDVFARLAEHKRQWK
jgi:putative addiction module component (TIGR02574 family)